MDEIIGMDNMPQIDEKRLSAIERAHKMKGKRSPCSEETKKKISEANKGKSSPFKGMTHTEEAKQKMRKNHGIKIKCVEENKIFNSIKEAAKFLCLVTGTYIIKAAEEGTEYYGYHWKFVD